MGPSEVSESSHEQSSSSPFDGGIFHVCSWMAISPGQEYLIYLEGHLWYFWFYGFLIVSVHFPVMNVLILLHFFSPPVCFSGLKIWCMEVKILSLHMNGFLHWHGEQLSPLEYIWSSKEQKSIKLIPCSAAILNLFLVSQSAAGSTPGTLSFSRNCISPRADLEQAPWLGSI